MPNANAQQIATLVAGEIRTLILGELSDREIEGYGDGIDAWAAVSWDIAYSAADHNPGWSPIEVYNAVENSLAYLLLSPPAPHEGGRHALPVPDARPR